MTVPNYRGIYGTCQRYFDPDILLRHNLDIMTCDALARLAPEEEQLIVRTYASGRLHTLAADDAKTVARTDRPRPLVCS